MRRTADVLAASAATILLLPLLTAVALAVLLTDGRPVLFRQTRVGQGGRPFLIWKYRTMRLDAEGRSITAAGDPRVTPLGGWLRRFKLDELPQLVNVLRGDMSLIGPRPEVPDYVQFDDPVWREVLETRPGVTDLASLTFRDEEQLLKSVPDADRFYRVVILPAKLRLNVRYLRGRSFRVDLKLLWWTAVYSWMPARFDRGRVLRLLASANGAGEESWL